ncbi:MAG: beta-mannanase [Ruminococcaceae bacterium]|nr:beta-mannanase [Oscillospiraceae bacterium]
MSIYKTNMNKLLKELEEKKVDPDCLVSSNANETTKRLFEYMKSIYGKNILSGQQYLQPSELEDAVYYRITNRLPAVRGYDFMDIDKKLKQPQTDRAIYWAKNSGCIITMCWHWYAPDNINDTANCDWAFYYKTTNYDRKTSFDIIKAVEEGTAEYKFAIDEIDKVARELKRFEAEDIPVLWRPLHEADGNWFWWGNRKNDGGESVRAYKKLWYIIFDRLENYHRLTNLIWVWNGQSREMAVNPNTFDFCGEDIYSELPLDHSSQKERYLDVTSYTYGKRAALSECGYMPDPENLKKDNVKWLWWLPWWGGFVYKRDEHYRPVFDKNGLPLHNPEKFSESELKSFFENDYCLTLDKLPWYSEKNAEFVKGIMKERFGL